MQVLTLNLSICCFGLFAYTNTSAWPRDPRRGCVMEVATSNVSTSWTFPETLFHSHLRRSTVPSGSATPGRATVFELILIFPEDGVTLTDSRAWPSPPWSATQTALCKQVGMCYWRRVRNTYKVCGHVVNLPDEEIKCDLHNCKFSLKHSKSCVPPQCTKSCWQYHQYPQQYAPQIDKKCPKCSGLG